MMREFDLLALVTQGVDRVLCVFPRVQAALILHPSIPLESIQSTYQEQSGNFNFDMSLAEMKKTDCYEQLCLSKSMYRHTNIFHGKTVLSLYFRVLVPKQRVHNSESVSRGYDFVESMFITKKKCTFNLKQKGI